MTGLTLKRVSKQFKSTGYTAVRDVNLEVANDEFLVILGPSGSGKTTLLRIIAGLESPTEGEVLIDGELANDLEPQDRGIGMVFQNYALYPHMTIRENLSFSLKIPWYKKEERKKVVDRVAEIMDIQRYFNVKPYQLSGGERQRVAMGRAMVNECRLYLMDEPLSNLDDNLRSRLRPEILKLFHQLQVPFLYVTHDQTDAMTMGTKIAVMRDGMIQQMGTPYQIYNEPATIFVAGFVGTPKMNLVPVSVTLDEGETVLKINDLTLRLPEHRPQLDVYRDKQVILGIRPEDILTQPDANQTETFARVGCELRHYEYLGNKVYLYLDLHGNPLSVTASSQVRARLNQSMDLYVDLNKIHLFDPETEERI